MIEGWYLYPDAPAWEKSDELTDEEIQDLKDAEGERIYEENKSEN